MKKTSIFTLMLAGITMSTLAETLEFRKFTLEPAKGQKQLTLDQITKVINDNSLGINGAIKINDVNGKISYTDTTTIKYASEYNDDLTIKELDSQELGTTIQGSTKKLDDHIEVTFKYKYSAKTKDIIYKTKGNRVILSPVFNSLMSSTVVTLDLNNNQWFVASLTPAESGKQTFLAIRILNKKMKNKSQ